MTYDILGIDMERLLTRYSSRKSVNPDVHRHITQTQETPVYLIPKSKDICMIVKKSDVHMQCHVLHS